MASDRPTWLHALGAVGYQPELIGRLHAIGPDQLHGYATRQVGDHSSNWPGGAAHDMGPLDRTNNPEPESLVACGVGRSAYELKDRDVTAATLAALDRHARDGTKFALTVGLMLPHAPYVAARNWIEYYLDRLELPDIPATADPHPWIRWWRAHRGIEDVPESQTRLARAAYWGLVSTMDEMIGQILERLEALGLSDDTLVVYASDHGDHVGDRGLWWKHTFFDESAKVPMILARPGSIEPGSVSTDVVSLMDLSQTMVEAMGGAPLPYADGRSFWSRVTGQEGAWNDEIFCEYCYDAVPEWTGGKTVQARMVRQGRWKLIYYAGHEPMLFDLEADPHEQEDLAADPAQTDRVQRLTRRILDGWDPAAIAHEMSVRRTRKDVLAAWARKTRPDSTHIWPMTPEMNVLEGHP